MIRVGRTSGSSDDFFVDQYEFLNKGITKKEIISVFEHENHRFKLQNEAKIQEKWPLFSVQIYIDDVPTGFFECQGAGFCKLFLILTQDLKLSGSNGHQKKL